MAARDAQSEWRLGRGWTDAELAERIQEAQALAPNFDASAREMTREAGWSQVRSRSRLAREGLGPPEPGGAYERARGLIEAFDFSDPRIVRWHSREGDALEGRRVMLELLAPLGLRYLCPVRVGGIREEQGDASTLYGFSFETLEGHFEVGREWFLLSKDHASGEVHFTIEAAWQPGAFPTWWAELGFLVVGARYQRAWHRLTHVRLRRLLRAGQQPETFEGEAGVAHAGHDVVDEPVQVFAQKALGRRKTKVEHEEETVQDAKTTATRWWLPLGLGWLAGMRSMSAPALVSARLTGRPLSGALPWAPRPLAQLLQGKAASRALAVLAAGELVADKLPMTPARTQALSLVGRALSGALVGAVAGEGQGVWTRARGALLGAGAAVAASFVLARLRQLATERLEVPNVLAGMVEDAAVVALGARLAPQLERGGATA